MFHRDTINRRVVTSLFGACLAAAIAPFAQAGVVDSHTRFERTLTVFPDPPGGDVSSFGQALAFLGDLDCNGSPTPAIAIGSPRDSLTGVPGSEHGNVFIAFLDSNGQLMPNCVQQIKSIDGANNEGTDRFGGAIAVLGDLNADGIVDIAVGGQSDGPTSTGAVWILMLNANGTVNSSYKIGAGPGGDMQGDLDGSDAFGNSIASLGILDGPCGPLPAIAVGADGDDDGGSNRGALWILFLNPDGSVACKQKISQTSGGFGGQLTNHDRFGLSACRCYKFDPGP